MCKDETWTCISCYPSVFPFSELSLERLKLINQAKDNAPDIFSTNMDHAISDMKNYYSSINGLDIALDNNDDLNINCKYYTPSELNDKNFHLASLSIAHLNISSLSYHLDSLKNLINSLDKQFDVIGISESRIRDLNHNSNIELESYKIVQCPTESTKGGSLLYISKNLEFVERPDLKIYQANELESVFVEIEGKNKN